MIKNQKQAGVTRKKLDELIKAKTELESQRNVMEPTRYELTLDSLVELITQLDSELSLYNCLTEGNFNCLHSRSFEKLSEILIAARLAQKLSHEDLGKLLDLDGQQIQRYEATDYESASLERLCQIAMALNLKLEFAKILIINFNQDNSSFSYPVGISAESIEEAEKKISRNGCLTL